MKYEEIEPYIIDYIQGDLEESKSYLIQAYLKENPDFQKELDELKDTLVFVQDSPLLEPEPELKMKFYGMLNEAQAPQESPVPDWQSNWLAFFQKQFFVRSASVLAFLFVIFLAGYYTATLRPESDGEAAPTSISLKPNQKPDANTDPSPEKDALAREQFAQSEDKPQSFSDSLSYKRSKPTNAPVPGAQRPIIASRDDEAKSDLLSLNEDVQEKEMDEMDFEEAMPPPPPVERTRSANLFDKESSARGRSQTLLEENKKQLSRTAAAKGAIASPDPQSDERIQLVYAQMEAQIPQNRIIDALISTLNTDPNPNVRIAAIDALERFSGQAQVRTLIARSLNNQSSPTVQLATIDLLVKYQIKAGAPFLEKLLDQSGLNPSVRVQAQLALEILS